MYHHPAFARALVRDHVAELRHSAGTAGGLTCARESRRPNLIAATRLGTGWLLIDVGLRLAMPRGGAQRPAVRGQR